ncbi:protein phosphatase 2C domain-containing protein [Sphingomonas sp. RB56-2]|uniref:Protein phosphatase 2C domain-containing protein n=1 Tax=Sphingomonas brevis TaxID=2908206 RepID=A0ABT0SA78_9SPHN|nr:protein phosphatase 2C domain-containing protein [Sphingomonas brevis]
MGLRRKINEDSMIALTDRGLWAVADGMGGHEAGDVASGKVVEALGQLHTDTSLDVLVEQAISSLQNVNRQLIALAEAGGRRTIGTTVVGLAISDGLFCCFWAGDSRAYRVRGGVIEQISRDHSVVQDLVDAGMLDSAGARDHPNSNLITRAVGVAEDLKVDIVSGEVQSGDLFLLGSDGLTRMVDDDELAAELTSNSLDDAADRLIDMVLSRGAPDNVTLIITRCV